MAIGAGEKVTTTGFMDSKPSVPQPPNLTGLGKTTPQPKGVKQQQETINQSPKDSLRQQFPEATDMELEFAERVKSLTREDMTTLTSNGCLWYK